MGIEDIEDIFLEEFEEKEWETYFRLHNFRLVTNKTSYGPFGFSDKRVRKPVIIPIDNGNVVAQAISSFIYPNESFKTKDYELL